MKKKLIVLSSFVLGLAPVVALAQVTITGTSSTCASLDTGASTLYTLFCKIGALLNGVLPVLIALGVLYFVWGVVQYVIASEEEAKKAGRDKIIFGIIGLAVIIGMWGLVKLVQNTFDLNNTANIRIPSVPVVIPTPVAS